ncbi:hypothetical protein D3C81_1730450 [compost metagenome]
MIIRPLEGFFNKSLGDDRSSSVVYRNIVFWTDIKILLNVIYSVPYTFEAGLSAKSDMYRAIKLMLQTQFGPKTFHWFADDQNNFRNSF